MINLDEAALSKESLLCLGLDCDDPLDAINILDECAELCAVIKFNLAFWLGYDNVLQKMIERAQSACCYTILDGKFGDIGNTAKRYATWCANLGVDAVTVNPYMGSDTQQAFMDRGLYTFTVAVPSNNCLYPHYVHPR